MIFGHIEISLCLGPSRVPGALLFPRATAHRVHQEATHTHTHNQNTLRPHSCQPQATRGLYWSSLSNGVTTVWVSQNLPCFFQYISEHTEYPTSGFFPSPGCSCEPHLWMELNPLALSPLHVCPSPSIGLTYRQRQFLPQPRAVSYTFFW